MVFPVRLSRDADIGTLQAEIGHEARHSGALRTSVDGPADVILLLQRGDGLLVAIDGCLARTREELLGVCW
jgi:hypothetical protein